jgi:dGTPase
MEEAEGVVRDLFRHYTTHPHDLPSEWAQGLDQADEQAMTRRVADYIAGMTDRYALGEHARYFSSTPELR